MIRKYQIYVIRFNTGAYYVGNFKATKKLHDAEVFDDYTAAEYKAIRLLSLSHRFKYKCWEKINDYDIVEIKITVEMD